MKKTFVTRKFIDSLEKNTMLTLEQAQWYMQGVGDIPLPADCNKVKTKVIFCDSRQKLYLKLVNSRISKFKISALIAKETNTIEVYIYAFEIDYDTVNWYYTLKGKYKSEVYHYALMNINKITDYVHASKKADFDCQPKEYKLTYSFRA